MPDISAIIVAGGSSARMKGTDKLFFEIGGITVLEHSIMAFQRHELITEIIVATAEDNLKRVAELCMRHNKVKAVVPGGAHRNASVQNGVAACSPEAAYYAIHDAARPFVSGELISRICYAAFEYGAAAPGLPLSDTVKEIDDTHTAIINTPDRSRLVAVATPQVFEAMLYRSAAKHQGEVYDDCQILENVGRKVKIVDGDPYNIKITVPEDIRKARFISGDTDMRIGQGYDVHRLVESRKLILGGVEIEHDTGLLGHSDADVLIHAIIDALLGAAGLGDIGMLFPDSDVKYKDVSSIKLLCETAALIAKKGYSIGNIDATVICQTPKLRPYIDAMRGNIAKATGVGTDKINIKATTEEGLGFTGDKSGIAAQAAAMLVI